jgi:hypothetical protein
VPAARPGRDDRVRRAGERPSRDRRRRDRQEADNPRTGAYTVYATGFTMAMDLDFGDDGTLYVLEIDSDNILGGSTDGGIWTVSKRGVKRKLALPAGTLTEPGGLAVERHDQLYVSNRARTAGKGEVLRIDLN